MNNRKDKRGRLLHNGEVQMKDGRYRFRYKDIYGNVKSLYSWRLDHNDSTPRGTKRTLSLREQEKQIEVDWFDHIVTRGGNLTVYDLVEKYVATKSGVRRTTSAGYKTVLNLLKKDPIGKKRIDTIRTSDAKLWIIKLQQKDKKSYSTIHTIRGVLRPAFQMAVEDDYLRKNPFDFILASVIVNDSVTREALTGKQERNFLKFVKEDSHFSQYYDGMYILFKTGLRIGEFCGLTVSDIDFKNHCLTVKRQLQKEGSHGYYIEVPKTENGNRTIPLVPEVEKCFRNMIEHRNPPKVEPTVNGVTGFLSFDLRGNIMYPLHWEHYFSRAVRKYNEIYKVPLPKITPHVCRHTYCSNMARSGMNPKTLQYLMGHGDISVTLNTYTHVRYEDAVAEISKIGVV